MATITTDLICNLNQPVAATFLHGNLFSQDNAGNTINVHVMDNGEPATIGGTVSANVIRADGNTVAVSGAIDGNKAYVILPQACYAVPGRVEIIIKLTQSTTITTIAAIVANVYRSTTDTVVDPGTIIPSIQTLIAEIEEAVDSIPVDYSGLLATIAADYSSSKTYPVVGMYAWQGGVLKRNIVPITTAETYTAAHWTNAVLGDDVSALKSAIEETELFNLLDSDDDTYVDGYYVDGNGNLVQANGYFVSNHIACPGGGKTYVCTYASATGATPVRVYNSSGSRLANVTGTLSSDGKYLTFSIPVSANAAYFTVNGRTALTEFMIVEGTEYPESYVPSVALKDAVKLTLTEDYQKLENDNAVISDVLGMIYSGEQSVATSVAVQGYFVNATNDSINASSNFNISNSIALEKGQIISVTAQGYSTVVGMICIYDAVNDKYLTVVASTDNTLKEYTYTASQKCSVRISYNKTYTPVVKITTTDTTSTVLNDLIDANQKTIIEYPQMFDNVVFVGDSLTYGHDGNTRLTKNYPFFFGKLADCTVSNQGLSGRTAKEWWDELGVSFDFSGFDCAIIYLGTNQGLTDTVDDDCKEDYTQNTDNNTGCYGKIIGKIQATNPGCKIFLIAGPEEYHSRETAMNPAVRSLASFYDCGLIDLEDSILSDDGTTTSRERKLYRPVDGIHYDVLGYLTFANLVYDSMTNVMSANLADYKY